MARYRLMEWLNFISTEVHKAYSPLFTPGMPEEGKTLARQRLMGRFAYIDAQLAKTPYLMGEHFSVPDAYLYTTTRWGAYVGVDLSGFAHLQAFIARMRERPAVQAALQAEGLS